MARRVNPAFILLAVLVAVSAWVIVTRWRLTTDMSVFMPPAATPIERLLVQQLNKGATSRLIFVAISGTKPQLLADINKSLAERLHRSRFLVAVRNGAEGVSEQSEHFVFRHRYLLSGSDLTERFSVAGLREALQERLRELASPLGAIAKRYMAEDPTGEFQALVDQWRGSGAVGSQAQRRYGVWFSADASRSIMVLEIKPNAFDLRGQSDAIAEIRGIFAEVTKGGARLTLTGPPVFAVETRDTLRSDLRLLSVSATGCVAVFLLLAFRSVTFVILLGVPLTLGVVVAVAAVLLVFGAVHGITLAFGVTLTGVAVDYPIHFFSQLDSRQSRTNEHIHRIWPTLRLGVLTTVVAYASLLFSDFEGLTQLGLFTVAGLLSAAGVTRWVLPLLMPREVRVRPGLGRLHSVLVRGAWLARRQRVVPALVIVACSAYLILTEQPIREYDIDALSAISEPRRAEDWSLREELGMWTGGRFLAVVGATPELVLRESEDLAMQLDMLRQDGRLEGYTMAGKYLPSVRNQQQRQAAFLPDASELKRRLTEASQDLPFRPGIFDPFLTAIDQARQQPPVTVESLEGTEFMSLLAPLLFQNDAGCWVAVIFLSGVAHPEDMEKLTGRKRDTDVAFIDIRQESSQLMANVMERMIQVLSWGGAAIYLVLVWAFRDIRKPLSVLGPTIAAVVAVSTLLLLAGQPLTLFHMISLLLVVGLGLDYTLFFNRLGRNDPEWETTFKAIWVCCVTTMLAFGMLLFSHAPSLRSIGLTVALGAAFCFVFGAAWWSPGKPSQGGCSR